MYCMSDGIYVYVTGGTLGPAELQSIGLHSLCRLKRPFKLGPVRPEGTHVCSRLLTCRRVGLLSAGRFHRASCAFSSLLLKRYVLVRLTLGN